MAAQQLITVPFHGNHLFITTYNDEPYTPMKSIVEGMGLDWGGQHKKLVANSHRWGVTIMEIPSEGGTQQAICLPLRKLPGWLMTLQPSRVAPELREKIITYQNECDDALWDYWTKGQAVNPASSFDPMAFDRAGKALIGMVKTLLPQHSLRQSYLIANEHVKIITGHDVLSVWPICLEELDDSVPLLPGRKLAKTEPPARTQLDRLLTIIGNAKKYQDSKFTKALKLWYMPEGKLLAMMKMRVEDYRPILQTALDKQLIVEHHGNEFGVTCAVYTLAGGVQ